MKLAVVIFVGAFVALMVGADQNANAVNVRRASCNANNKMCTREYRPVCATDLQTYSTECMLCKQIEATRNMDLKVLHEGECTAQELSAAKDHPEIKPVLDNMKKIAQP